jgi:hypothetical protein
MNEKCCASFKTKLNMKNVVHLLRKNLRLFRTGIDQDLESGSSIMGLTKTHCLEK